MARKFLTLSFMINRVQHNMWNAGAFAVQGDLEVEKLNH